MKAFSSRVFCSRKLFVYSVVEKDKWEHMLITRFIRFLKYEKNYSEHTLLSYEKNLRAYEGFLEKQQTSITDATSFSLRAFLAGQKEKGIQPRSINQTISSLRSFYKFLIREKLLVDNPMQRIRLLRTPKNLPSVVPEEKLCALLDSDVFGEDFKGLRERLIMELLFSTGIRRAELIAIRESDWDVYQQQLRILGKGNKERILPVTSGLSRILEQYRSEKNVKFQGASPYLLVDDQGRPLKAAYVYQVVQGYLGRITSQKKRSPHVLRHTFATALLNRGASISDIKELLGHASLASTQVYAHNSVERLKSIYKQAHPKA